MSEMIMTSGFAGTRAAAMVDNRATRRLLACGLAAGPLFLAVGLIQAFARDGFDLRRHPLSLLSLGPLGWIQIADFVLTGAMVVACAVGARRVLRPGPGGTWGPLLVGTFGVGLIIAGVFVTDAGAGFPPGAPAGVPEHISWHGMVHEVGFLLAFIGMMTGCLVLVRRFAGRKRPVWVATCVTTPFAVLVVASWPDVESLSVRLVVATAILLGFVAALAVHLRRDLTLSGQAQSDS